MVEAGNESCDAVGTKRTAEQISGDDARNSNSPSDGHSNADVLMQDQAATQRMQVDHDIDSDVDLQSPKRQRTATTTTAIASSFNGQLQQESPDDGSGFKGELMRAVQQRQVLKHKQKHNHNHNHMQEQEQGQQAKAQWKLQHSDRKSSGHQPRLSPFDQITPIMANGRCKVPSPEQVLQRLQQVANHQANRQAHHQAHQPMPNKHQIDMSKLRDLPPRPPPCSPAPVVGLTEQLPSQSNQHHAVPDVMRTERALQHHQRRQMHPRSGSRARSRSLSRATSRSRSRTRSRSQQRDRSRPAGDDNRQKSPVQFFTTATAVFIIVALTATVTFWGWQPTLSSAINAGMNANGEGNDIGNGKADVMDINNIIRQTLLKYQQRPAASADSAQATAPHVLPPTTTSQLIQSDITLRDFLLHPDGIDLAMAPAFFGFYGYFGALAAWQDELDHPAGDITGESAGSSDHHDDHGRIPFLKSPQNIRSVAGASAGAMAAVLLAAGVDPTDAAEFCTTITLDQFADPPALGAAFKGDKFESIMQDFLVQQSQGRGLNLEDAVLPIAVSGFDLQTMSGVLLKRGSMARAARASATFPLLFQPVGWKIAGANQTSSSNAIANANSSSDSDGSTNDDGGHNNDDDDSTELDVPEISLSTIRQNLRRMGQQDGIEDYTLIDGGITDMAGLNGLGVTRSNDGGDTPSRSQRVVNMVIGSFVGGIAPGPANMPDGVNAAEVVSISLRNMPNCGPWAMENGPVAVDVARRMMRASMDVPLYRGLETGHYELHLDASAFEQ